MDDKACSKIAWLYTCQLSRLRRESHACRLKNFDLLPAHGSRPISYTWLKNVSCCCLAWHNFQTFVNSDPCKERKPCVKWINDNIFLAISDIWSEKHLERACVYTRPKTSEDFRRLRTSSEDFELLWKTSDFFKNLRKWSCHLQKCQHFQDINLTHIKLSQKKLAGIWLLYMKL